VHFLGMMEVKERFSVHSFVSSSYTLRQEMFEGRKHFVVPVVMIREGVHNGSHGPIFHRAEQLSRFVEAWNGIPVTIEHPAVDGQLVSANSPKVLEQFAVGRIFNAHYDDGLKAEAWLDEQKVISVNPSVLGYLQQGRPLDVSVGVFSEDIPGEGDWEGETYTATATNYRPNHLALLPGEQGACSWADGCGVRANKGGKMDDLLKSFKELSQKGFTVSPMLNAEGYMQVMDLIQQKLNAMDDGERYYYLEEVFDDYIIYRVRTSESGSSTLYKRGYTVNGEEVTLAEEPVKVKKEVSYVTMEAAVQTNKEGETMSDKSKPCCEAKVDELIANKQSQFTAEDKEWLLALKEEQIEKLTPVEEADKGFGVQANMDEAIATFKATLTTIEDYTALMPEEMRAQIDAGVKMYQEKREALIAGIKANSEFTEDELKVMNDAYLEKLSKSINKVADYSGQGAGGSDPKDKKEKLLPAGVKAQ